jgi:integrase
VDDRRYKLDHYIVPVLGSIQVADLTTADVVRLLDRLATWKRKKAPHGLSANTRTRIVAVLSSLMRYAVKRGLAERNVVRDLDRDDRPGTARATEPGYLTATEIERLLSELSDVFRPIACACTFAALRHAEALGLRWRDADFDAKTITVSGQLAPTGVRVPYAKTTASAATIDMLAALERELRAHRMRQAARNLRLVQPDALVLSPLPDDLSRSATCSGRSTRQAMKPV